MDWTCVRSHGNAGEATTPKGSPTSIPPMTPGHASCWTSFGNVSTTSAISAASASASASSMPSSWRVFSIGLAWQRWQSGESRAKKRARVPLRNSETVSSTSSSQSISSTRASTCPESTRSSCCDQLIAPRYSSSSLGEGYDGRRRRTAVLCSTSLASIVESSASIDAWARYSVDPANKSNGKSKKGFPTSPRDASWSSIESRLRSCWTAFGRQCHQSGTPRWRNYGGYGRKAARDLAAFLEDSGLELEDVYTGGKSWSDLQEAAGAPVRSSGPEEISLRRACGRMLHVDDRERLDEYRRLLQLDAPAVLDGRGDRSARLARMLVSSLPSQDRGSQRHTGSRIPTALGSSAGSI